MAETPGRSSSTGWTSPQHSGTQHLHDNNSQLLRLGLRWRPAFSWTGNRPSTRSSRLRTASQHQHQVQYISTEDGNSRPWTSTFSRRTCSIQTSSRKTTMGDIHQTRHQLCNRRTSKSIAEANNSRSTKAETPSQVHQGNKALQADHSTNSESPSKSNSWPQRFRRQRLGRMSHNK